MLFAAGIAGQYANLYPQTMPGASLATTQASLASWRNNNAQAIQQALAMQNLIAQGQPTTTSQVQSVVSASQGAAGQTSAIQATNQLRWERRDGELSLQQAYINTTNGLWFWRDVPVVEQHEED